MLQPKHTLESVAQTVAEGLIDGSLTLEPARRRKTRAWTRRRSPPARATREQGAHNGAISVRLCVLAVVVLAVLGASRFLGTYAECLWGRGNSTRGAGALVEYLVSTNNVERVTVSAIVGLTLGLLLLLQGARVIRLLIVIACLGVGGYYGAVAGRDGPVPTALCMLGGAVLGGTSAVVLRRLWVAALAGVSLAGAVLCVYVYYENLPGRLLEFARADSRLENGAQPESLLDLLKAGRFSATGEGLEALRRFGDSLDKTDTRAVRRLSLCLMGALMIGTMIGIVAARAATIVWTSLTGCILLMGGTAVLAKAHWARLYENASHWAPPGVVVAILICIVGALIQSRKTTRSNAV